MSSPHEKGLGMRRRITPNSLRFAPLLFVVLALASEAAPRAETTAKPKPAKGAQSCWEIAATQGDLTGCAGKDALSADEKLNKSFQAVMCHLGPEEKAQLRAAERAWIAFRDADCAFWGGGGGSIAPMNALQCRTALSLERAKELDNWPPNAPRDALVPCK